MCQGLRLGPVPRLPEGAPSQVASTAVVTSSGGGAFPGHVYPLTHTTPHAAERARSRRARERARPLRPAPPQIRGERGHTRCHQGWITCCHRLRPRIPWAGRHPSWCHGDHLRCRLPELLPGGLRCPRGRAGVAPACRLVPTPPTGASPSRPPRCGRQARLVFAPRSVPAFHSRCLIPRRARLARGRRGPAPSGPLHAGAVGAVVATDSSDCPYKIELTGDTGWYHAADVELATPEPKRKACARRRHRRSSSRQRAAFPPCESRCLRTP